MSRTASDSVHINASGQRAGRAVSALTACQGIHTLRRTGSTMRAESNPFIRSTNVTFGGAAWTEDFSSGEMIRSGYDQTLTINPCRLQFLYQGDDPNGNPGAGYNSIPWRIGMVTQTNSTC
jgi:hypothetical protein